MKRRRFWSKVSFDTSELGTSGALFYQARVRRDPSIALKVFDAHAHGPEGNDPSFLLTRAVLQKQADKPLKRRPRSRAVAIFWSSNSKSSPITVV